MTIKYTIPSLTASARTPFPSVSKAARHMAHWASAGREKNIQIRNMHTT